MNKNDLTPFCRYYKGEKKNPFKNGDNAVFWVYEMKWIEFTLEACQNKDTVLSTYIDEYIAAGLSQFEITDKVPATLKALLFNRYLHFTSYSLKEGAEHFKTFYIKQYKKSAQ